MAVTPWKKMASEYVLRTPWFSIRKDACQLPDGSIIDDYYVGERPDAVSILALTPDNQVIINTQYKHGCERVCREFPAGAIDVGETPLHAAQRELEEETGHRAREWVQLGNVIVSPSNSANRDIVFLALGCEPTGRALNDAREEIEHAYVPIEDVVRDVYTGRLDILWVIGAVYLALPQLHARRILPLEKLSGIIDEL